MAQNRRQTFVLLTKNGTNRNIQSELTHETILDQFVMINENMILKLTYN